MALRTEKEQPPSSPHTAKLPKVLLIGPSLRIMGGQAVMADRMVRAMRGDGVDIGFLPINPQPPGFLRHAEKVKYLRTLVVSLFYLVSLLRRVRQYDVIHLFSASYSSFIISQTPALLIARLYRKPVILNYRSGEAEDHLRRWGRSIFWILRLADRIVVPSGFLVDVFRKFGFEATSVFNVIDPEAIRYRLRSSAEPRIVVPRALEPLYNVACAIRAFAIVSSRFPHAELTILGDGSQRRELEKLVQELGLRNVHFMGRVERDQIGECFDSHDIFLNTSSIDNMPVSLLEGFAAGLPIVTTDAGGIPYLVQDRQNAHLVPVDDHQAAADRIMELLDRPDEIERLSRQGQVEVQKYLWSSIAPAWYDLYRDTWQRRRAPDQAVHRQDNIALTEKRQDSVCE